MKYTPIIRTARGYENLCLTGDIGGKYRFSPLSESNGHRIWFDNPNLAFQIGHETARAEGIVSRLDLSKRD